MIADMTSQGLLREARAVVFTVLALSVSVALHSWASGALPPMLAILAGGGLVGLSAVVLAGRERGFLVIAALLLAAQGGLHGLFSIVPPTGGHAMVMPPPAHAGRAMLLAHLIAWVATAGWLYAGEVAVWRLARWVARRIPSLGALFALLGLVVLAPAPRAGRGWLAERRVPLPIPAWWGSVIRRGPPVSLAVTR